MKDMSNMRTPLNQRSLLRAAVAIQAAISDRPRDDTPDLPMAAWAECCRLKRLHNRAKVVAKLPLAASRLRKQLQAATTQLLTRTRALTSDLAVNPSRVASAFEIAAELQALVEEFHDVRVNGKERTISVTTEAIVLEDVCLGRFRLTLDWRHLQDGIRGLSVVALDPVSAASNDRYVHPHVDGENLCAGDGKLALQAALTQGRMCDFFVVVRQILNTYNSSSAYVQLEEWFSRECCACGDWTAADEMRDCERCDTSLCRECVSGCSDCSGDFCSDCTSVCADCDSETCATCLNECDGCGNQFCERCFDDGQCLECNENQEAEETAAAETVSPT